MKKLILTNFDKKGYKSSILGDTMYLGHWCNYDNQIDNKYIIKYIWSDRKLYLKDYKYLKKIYYNILSKLTLYLNKLHSTKYSKRYWSILLNPWLISFIINSYEKWKSIERLPSKKFKINLYNIQFTRDFLVDDYKLFGNEIVQQFLCQKIINYKFKKKFNINYQKKKEYFTFKKKKKIEKFSFRKYIYFFFDQISKITPFKKKFILLDTYHNFISQCLLNFSKFQLPRLIYNEFELGYKKNKIIKRKIISNNKKKNFYQFILLYINEFLPSEFVEDFFNIKTLVNKKINIPTKKILVGRSLWENTFKKFWVASQINEKKLLYLVEHGGGLPDKYYHFDYLINYSDKFLSWAKLKNKKSYQLPADKFMFKCQFSFFKKKKEKFIIIEPIFERYLQTLSSRSVSSLYHEHTQMINLFISNLNEDLKNRSYIKLSPINEIHTNKFYTLKNFTNYNWSIEKVITEAKLLICTYPMTTLSEVIMSSKPFILIYPENIYLRNFQQNNKVIKKMKKAKILFSDSEKAATHLNNISSNIEGWWNTNEVKESLKIYKKYCLGLHKSDFKNIKRWIEFLN